MQNEELFESELSLKELLVYVRMKWKFVLVMTLSITILFGSYKSITDNVTADQYDLEYSKYKKEFDLYQINLEMLQSQIEDIQLAKERVLEYNRNSIKMNLNPLAYGEGRVEYYIKSDYVEPKDIDVSSNAFMSYLDYINNGLMYQQICDNISNGNEVEYIKEIIQTTVDYNKHTIVIVVSQKSEELCQEIIDLINLLLVKKSKEIVTEIGEHQLVKSEETVNSRKNFSLGEYQDSSNDSVRELKKNEIEIKKELAELKVPSFIYDNNNIVKKSILLAIIGGIFGFLLATALVVVRILFSNRIYSITDLKKRTNIDVISIIPKKPNKKSLLLRENGIRESITVEEGIELIYEIINNTIVHIEITSELQIPILLIGSNDSKRYIEVCDRLVKLMNKSNVIFVQGMNIVDDIDTIRKLKDFKYIILMEQFNCSKIERIENEVATLRKLDKYILGTVIIE